MWPPRLIDIHSQHANAKLSDPAEQLRVVDLLSDNKAQLAEYRKEFAAYVDIRRRPGRRCAREMSKSAENADFMKFQLEAADKPPPRRGELVETERRFEVLSDADEIRDRPDLGACSVPATPVPLPSFRRLGLKPER